MNPDLTIIWAFLIAFAVAMYVVMDGFDLGIGTWYIFKLMSRPPHPAEPEPAEAPIRTAGITPAASVDNGGADPRPDRSEGAEG